MTGLIPVCTVCRLKRGPAKALQFFDTEISLIQLIFPYLGQFIVFFKVAKARLPPCLIFLILLDWAEDERFCLTHSDHLCSKVFQEQYSEDLTAGVVWAAPEETRAGTSVLKSLQLLDCGVWGDLRWPQGTSRSSKEFL